MNARLVRAAAVAAVAAASSACLVGPAWRTPRTDVPPAFRAPADAGPSLAELEWPALFQDPTLQGLIRDALARNHDVRIAAARVEAAAAQAGIARAALYPSIGYAASAARVDGSDTMVPGAGAPYNDYAAQATITWEADLWGKLRRTSESARESFLATEEARRAVAISLVANVAGLYCQLREFDAELEIARRTLAGRRENTRLIKGRFDGGVTSELDFRQAQIQEGDAAATIAALERSRALTENALNLLLGRPPGDVPRGLALDAQPVPPAIAPGLPSELLARRPDILGAEHAAHAALAQVGAAKALRLPSFGLTGALGLESFELSNFVKSASRSWSVAGSLAGPIYSFGRNKRRVEAAEAQAREAALAWEQSVVAAFREVEDALVGVRTARAEREARVFQADAARIALKLARARYDGGVSSFLEVLDVERSLFQAELQTVQARSREYQAVVQLYKALGGGWSGPGAPAPRESAEAPPR